jgi:EAL domain-containing protein (putative c-di-GMP-specific phosphodiesterase class I)/GGDEF domain-containing protein
MISDKLNFLGDYKEVADKLLFIDWHLELPNGLRLERDIEESAAKSSLIVYEVLSLSEINEVYGRETGNTLLTAISNYIYTEGVPNSTLYRIGGCKFCIRTEDMPPAELNALAESLFTKLETPWTITIDGVLRTLICKFTVGVIYARLLETDDAPLNIVDRILKYAKASVNRIVFYDEEMVGELKRRKQLEYSLKSCVANGMEGFAVYYQPIADPVTGIWHGVEALCRWISPDLGVVSPIEFITATERLGLIETLGLWVLETSVCKCKEWKLDKHNHVVLDVNLSAHQFLDINLADKIIDIIDRHSFPGHMLCLEITESTQFTFSGHTLHTFEKLKAKKISIALDDFGTGYSALNKLKEMPVDIVKIERMFVKDIESDNYMRFLFKSIAELAHAADMKLIAEGVETVEQMHILLETGADLLQGYLFSKPIPPDELEKNLSRFSDMDPSFNVINRRKVDVSALLSAENEFVLTPVLYKLLNKCVHILLCSDDVNDALGQVLQLVGQHIGVSRTYVILKSYADGEDELYTNTHEWCRDGVAPQKQNLQAITFPQSWMNMIMNDGLIIAYNVNELPVDIAVILTMQGINSLIVAPMWNKKELFGFVGFDECVNLRHWWWPEEVLMLHNLSIIIASVLRKTMR